MEPSAVVVDKVRERDLREGSGILVQELDIVDWESVLRPSIYSHRLGSSLPSTTHDQASSAPIDAMSSKTKPLARLSVRDSASFLVGTVTPFLRNSGGVSGS